jgi:hypothetical protein
MAPKAFEKAQSDSENPVESGNSCDEGKCKSRPKLGHETLTESGRISNGLATWSRGHRSKETVGRRLRNRRAEHLLSQTNQMGPCYGTRAFPSGSWASAAYSSPERPPHQPGESPLVLCFRPPISVWYKRSDLPAESISVHTNRINSPASLNHLTINSHRRQQADLDAYIWAVAVEHFRRSS